MGAFQDMWAAILELFVQNGANLNTVCIISEFGSDLGYEIETNAKAIIESAFQSGCLRSIKNQSTQRKIKYALEELEKHGDTDQRHAEENLTSRPYIFSTKS